MIHVMQYRKKIYQNKMGTRAIIILLYHVLGSFCFTPNYETVNFCSKTVNSLLLVVYLGNVSGARRSLSKNKNNSNNNKTETH